MDKFFSAKNFFRKLNPVMRKDGGVYLRRFWIIPRNPFLNIFVHKFETSDDLDKLHDHPQANISIILKGSYDDVVFEKLPKEGETLPRLTRRTLRPGSFRFRRSTMPHRAELNTPYCWTVFITGPCVRRWGYWIEENKKARWFVGNKFMLSEEFAGILKRNRKIFGPKFVDDYRLPSDDKNPLIFRFDSQGNEI